LIKENRKVHQHWTEVELKSAIQYNQKKVEEFSKAQTASETSLEAKVNQFSVIEERLLRENATKVQEEQNRHTRSQNMTTSKGSFPILNTLADKTLRIKI